MHAYRRVSEQPQAELTGCKNLEQKIDSVNLTSRGQKALARYARSSNPHAAPQIRAGTSPGAITILTSARASARTAAWAVLNLKCPECLQKVVYMFGEDNQSVMSV